jgi:cytochrome c oxidase subunit 2
MELLHHNISTYGGNVDELIWLITGFVVFWFAVSLFALIAFALMSRRKPGVKSTYVKGEGWNQTMWVMIPVVLVTLCDGIIDVKTSKVWEEVKGRVQKVEGMDPANIEEIGIKANQFGWQFSHDPGADKQFFTVDDPIIEAGELHVPVGKKIVFHLTAVDVLHSFWVKNLRLKQDALPGRFIIGWFEVDADLMKTWAGEGVKVLAKDEQPAAGTKLVEFADKGQRVQITPESDRKPLGENWAEADEKDRSFEIACAEICGYGHGIMKANLIVESPESYAKWIEHEKEELSEE